MVTENPSADCQKNSSRTVEAKKKSRTNPANIRITISRLNMVCERSVDLMKAVDDTPIDGGQPQICLAGVARDNQTRAGGERSAKKKSTGIHGGCGLN